MTAYAVAVSPTALPASTRSNFQNVVNTMRVAEAIAAGEVMG